MTKRRLITRIIIIISIILILYLIVRFSGLRLDNLTEERIRNLTNNNIWLILVLMFGIMFLQNLLNFIPIILVMSANVALLGLWKGYLFSLICSVIASTIIFLAFRYIFKDFKASPKFDTYLEKIEANGFVYILIARLIPVMPTNLINVAAGVGSIKLSHYVLATLIGNGIYGLIISSASFSIFS